MGRPTAGLALDGALLAHFGQLAPEAADAARGVDARRSTSSWARLAGGRRAGPAAQPARRRAGGPGGSRRGAAAGASTPSGPAPTCRRASLVRARAAKMSRMTSWRSMTARLPVRCSQLRCWAGESSLSITMQSASSSFARAISRLPLAQQVARIGLAHENQLGLHHGNAQGLHQLLQFLQQRGGILLFTAIKISANQQGPLHPARLFSNIKHAATLREQ